MKRKALGILMLCLASLMGELSASGDVAQRVDSLLLEFDSHKGAQAVQAARDFFDLLEEEEFIDESIKISTPSKTDSLKSLTWYWAGEWYFDIQNYELSMDYSQKAIKLCEKVGDKLLEADCSNIISILYFRKSDYPAALKYAKRTLEIGKELNDISRISYSLNTLAGICLASRQPAEGEHYILEAIRLCEQEKDSLKLAVRCGMAAEIYHSMGQEEKSLEYSERAYEINVLMGREDKAAIRLAQMAGAYVSMADYSRAKECLEKAIPVLKAAGNLQSWAISYNLLGEVYLNEDKPEEAQLCFQNALDVFTQRQDAYNEARSRIGLSKALINSDPAESTRQMLIYSQLRDSIYDSEMNRGLNEMHASYQNDKLQTDLQHYRKKSTAVIIVCVLLLTLALCIPLIIKKRRKENELSEEEEKSLTPNEVFMQTLENFIREEMQSGKVDFEVIASKMCMSRAHLNRKVKSITDGTTSDLVVRIRISRAKELLSKTNMPIWEVARSCGIEDPAYFSSLFKKNVGKTPNQFRNGS